MKVLHCLVIGVWLHLHCSMFPLISERPLEATGTKLLETHFNFWWRDFFKPLLRKENINGICYTSSCTKHTETSRTKHD
uniref:Putative secreted protein n=1 Tax=Anopheles marajoara TaxID=58244 RepID=A0A2M4CC27_9DIPT